MQKDKMDIGVFEEVWVYPDGRKEYRPSLPSFLHEYNVKNSYSITLYTLWPNF